MGRESGVGGRLGGRLNEAVEEVDAVEVAIVVDEQIHHELPNRADNAATRVRKGDGREERRSSQRKWKSQRNQKRNHRNHRNQSSR